MSKAKATTNTNEPQWGAKLQGDSEIKNMTALENGQSIAGTVRAIRPSKYEGQSLLVLELLNGETHTYSPAGTLKYDIREGKLKVGQTYKITREGSKDIKGKQAAVFGVYPAKSNTTTADADDSI